MKRVGWRRHSLGDWTAVLCCIISTDINIYLHIHTESFKYPHLKILLGNEGCDNLSLYSYCSTWIDVISYWCQTKTKKPNMAVTKNLNFLMYCLCIAGDDCCNPCIKKEDKVEEHDNENYEIMTTRVK